MTPAMASSHDMALPRPRRTVGRRLPRGTRASRRARGWEGVTWPRFAGYTRQLDAGKLPLPYRVAFGSSLGVDGAFLRHFCVTSCSFSNAVARAQDDHALAAWFCSLPSASPDRLAAWNERASNFGAKGYPGCIIRHLAKWVLSPKSVRRPVVNLFEAIDQDEGTSAFSSSNARKGVRDGPDF